MDFEKIKNHPRVELKKRLVSLHRVTKGSYLKYNGWTLSLYNKEGVKIAKLASDYAYDPDEEELVHHIVFNNQMQRFFT